MQALPPRNPIREFMFHWRLGQRHHIPLCCRAHFCLDRAAGRVVSIVRWRQMATWETPLRHENPWVPCGVLHRDYSPFSTRQRIMRIAAFNIATCLPGRRARRLRHTASTPGPLWTEISEGEKVRLSQQGRNGQLWWAQPTDSTKWTA